MSAHWLKVESCRAGFKSRGKAQLNALFSVVTMNADTDSASEENFKVIQGRVAHGTRSRILMVRNFKFNLSTF